MADPRRIVFIPADGFVEGHGFRVSFVIEGESGHFPTGTWPYTGGAGEQLPWFWGPTFAAASEAADKFNERLGIDAKTASEIVLGSIGKTLRKRTEGKPGKKQKK